MIFPDLFREWYLYLRFSRFQCPWSNWLSAINMLGHSMQALKCQDVFKREDPRTHSIVGAKGEPQFTRLAIAVNLASRNDPAQTVCAVLNFRKP